MSAARNRPFRRQLLEAPKLVGYWMVTPVPIVAERLALLGYDYIGFDMQHGIMSYDDVVHCLTAVDAADGVASVVRVPGNDRMMIGRALDAGASAVIVPMVDTPQDAEAAARACRYPPHGHRSFGPIRSGLRIGPKPHVADDSVACIAMIETVAGLHNVEDICRVPGIDAAYVGPSDLSLALGADDTRPEARPKGFHDAVDRVKAAAIAAGKACGIHCADGHAAAHATANGFTFATIASDLNHLENAARTHLNEARA